MKNMQPKITIITICYNAEALIAETIESVVNQTYGEIEYIIIDGGSKDRTVEIAKSYGDRVRKLISECDHGIYDAMNKGISHASGDWILFINSGDKLYDCNVIKRFVDYIQSQPERTVYIGSIITSIDNETRKVVNPKTKVSPWYTPPHQGMFFPREILEKEKYDLSYRILADRELYVRIIKSYGYTPVILPFIVAYYDLEGVSSDGSKALKIFAEAKRIQKKYGGHGIISARIRALVKYIIAGLFSSKKLTKLRY